MVGLGGVGKGRVEEVLWWDVVWCGVVDFNWDIGYGRVRLGGIVYWVSLGVENLNRLK